MELINREGTTDENGAKDRGIKGHELPQGRVVVREYFQFGVQVKIEVDKTSDFCHVSQCPELVLSHLDLSSQAAVVCPLGKDSSESLIFFSSPVQICKVLDECFQQMGPLEV